MAPPRVTLAALERDPHPLLAELRVHAPVAFVDALGGWLVTRRDLALAVMRDDARFTVADPRFTTAQVVGPSMLSLDGAAHARHRDPFAAAFRLAAVRARLQTSVEARASSLVGSLVRRGVAELRRDLAGPLAVSSMVHALSLASVEERDLLRWNDAIVAAVSSLTAGQAADPLASAAVAALAERVRATVAAGPAEALLPAVHAAGLAVGEVASNVAVLLFGGIETTEGMVANLFRHLLVHDDQLAALREDRSLMTGAIEESLRLEPAAAVVDRYATVDVELADAVIGRGDLVVVSIAAANRDPCVFAEPDRFDIRRPNARLHAAFAHGPHVCLGMHLARIEAAAALTAVLDLAPAIRLAAPPTAPTGLVFRKPDRLDVLLADS